MAEKGRLLRLVSGPANGQFRRILAIEHAPSIGWTCPLTDLTGGLGHSPNWVQAV